MTHIIRPDTSADYEAVTKVNDLAFGETAPSRIIKELRESGDALWSRVLMEGEELIGHVQFYKVTVDGKNIGVGLGPVSIHPDHQRKGFGSQLIRAGLEQVDTQKHAIMFVLGHVEYYPRFGFSSELGAQFKSPWPRPAFMAMKLSDAAPDTGDLTFPNAYL